MPPVKLQLKSVDEKYGIFADSLKALQTKAKDKFNLPGPAQDLIVKLEDGTIVDEEEYFQCMDPNTCYVVSDDQGKDEVDSMIVYSDQDKSTGLAKLVRSLQDDITSVAKFSEEQLEMVVNAEDLKSRLNLTADEVEGLQEACHMHQIERQKTTDAIELLKLYKNHIDSTDGSAPASKKVKC